ncbi:hypothetical protein Acr_01g0012830 [Actinidia rufa]|uniref:Uncharacterized protein n=1 Tax=Actinidia rufa TaxID=165716 RepID=A0A7J0E4Q6_9ERIC|nr:hypothetical protein Acr_01g0012830 [Actinidia rufa]
MLSTYFLVFLLWGVVLTPPSFAVQDDRTLPILRSDDSNGDDKKLLSYLLDKKSSNRVIQPPPQVLSPEGQVVERLRFPWRKKNTTRDAKTTEEVVVSVIAVDHRDPKDHFFIAESLHRKDRGGIASHPHHYLCLRYRHES